MKESISGGFIESFCKVEAVCYQGDPNWLGWLLLIPLGLLVFILACMAVYYICVGIGMPKKIMVDLAKALGTICILVWIFLKE